MCIYMQTEQLLLLFDHDLGYGHILTTGSHYVPKFHRIMYSDDRQNWYCSAFWQNCCVVLVCALCTRGSGLILP